MLIWKRATKAQKICEMIDGLIVAAPSRPQRHEQVLQ